MFDEIAKKPNDEHQNDVAFNYEQLFDGGETSKRETSDTVPTAIETESNSVIQNYSLLEDSSLLKVSPNALIDFVVAGKSGNRRKSARKNDAEFEASIRDRGIIQPVVARPCPTDPTKLELLGGYGRREKAIKLNLPEIPVLVRVVSDEEAFLIHLDENSKRSDVTLTDELSQVKEFASIFSGDRKSIAQRLGWTVKKVDERLALGNCTDKVIEQLDLNKIKPAHALILANFPETTQDNTVDKCILEAWTVEKLKERAGFVQSDLGKAKFDTVDCQMCKHNTGDQSDMFGTSGNSNKCSNFQCFKQKTLDHVKPKAIERFGNIIMLSESSDNIVNTVNESTVGLEQFKDGCTGCSKNVAIISDKIDTLGMVKASQCVDKMCFDKCIKANAPKSDETIAAKADPNLTSNKTAKGTKTQKERKVVSSKLSQTVVDHHNSVLREAAAEHLQNDVALQKAIQVASMIKHFGYDQNTFDSHFNMSVHYDSAKLIADLCQREVSELEIMLTVLSQHSMAASKANGNEMEKVMITRLAQEQSGIEVATNKWNATDANLKIYTKQILDKISTDSGFDSYLNDTDVKFSKLSSGSKGDYIASMVNGGFDWSNVAPKIYLDQLK